jgi:exopolysaccharide biosynthesis polyprenyl glycosylphosphotransferase
MPFKTRHLLTLLGFGAVLLEPATALGANDGRGVSSPDGFAEISLLVFAGLVAVASTLATAEVARRRLRSDGASAALSALDAQRVYARVLYGLAPAAVASTIVLLRQDDLSPAVFLFASMALTSALLRSHRHPLHLMPIARYAFNALVPAAGVGVALIPGLFGDPLIGPKTAVAATAAATLITLLSGFLADRFEADRPIRLAVIGPSNFTSKLAAELADAGVAGYKVIGFLADAPQAPSSGPSWLGEFDDVRDIVKAEGIDLLVVSPDTPRLPAFEHVARACLDLPVRMIEATALYEDVLGHVPIGTINSAWFQFIMHPRFTPSSPLSKRILDLVVTSLMVSVAGPFMLLAAIAVKLEDRGPVFFRQRRVGEEGHEFHMLKFRTMRDDADDLRDTHTEDELITRVGRILRKTHFNETPQLLQVLKGDMTLVGPRPEPPELVEALGASVPYYERRALVKPGLTGWAQVRCGYAGSRSGSAWKMCHDLYYIKHRSAGFDLMVLAQTIDALVERSREEQMPAPDFILGDPPVGELQSQGLAGR